jgi:hypothetical protein
MEQAPYQTPFDVDPGGGRRVVPKAVTAVYASPGPGLPDLAVIIMGRDVVFSQSVRSVEEGEKLLAHVLRGFADLAADSAGD